ncbi:TetR/AcrR family transcriptional regulator [Acrocarpospora macrocephala]|uniref:TetR family transcriptional regulator n=1 Tax=Acrocarpospora macrocephala TaxID=150177 RepID=A0A5M3WMN0_9ACTN|nr:TetR/AcrR family transcriptional regulator [Acrocarpospora macrocephala]GES10535.1 TetR family transcriptional regulator [Acrocarpospora macrocephala]
MTEHKPSRRQIQAAATRAEIISAARRLFAGQGYVATPISEIAKEAGVAVQTVYKVFGTKDAILLALLDVFEAEAREISSVFDFAAPADPAEQLRLVAAYHRALFDRGQDILDVFRAAAHGELAALWEEGGRRRRQAQAPLAEGWRDRLPEGLSPARAADILWALTSPEVYTLLVVESGWSGDAYQEWLAATLTRQLLGSP